MFSSRTIREFDSRFTAPQFGYPSEREYYEDAKLAGKLGRIRVPTLALNAEDDPCQVGGGGVHACVVCIYLSSRSLSAPQPGDSIPLDEIASTDYFAILTTRRGGHIGFMEGAWPTR